MYLLSFSDTARPPVGCGWPHTHTYMRNVHGNQWIIMNILKRVHRYGRKNRVGNTKLR